MSNKKDPVKMSEKEIETLLAMAKQSLQTYGALVPPREVLEQYAKGECPHCGHVGPLTTDFGFKKRTVDGKKRPQSWCNKCRNSSDSHPARKGT